MKIGDLLLGLGVDTAAFKPAIEKAAGEAGTAGAKKLSSTMSLGLKAGSVIVGAAFGLMTKGALEMEKAQGKFQAATGRSREEAIDFSKAMNGIVGSAKTVGQSFEEISDTGIAVAQQFGITGEKATALTEDILGFAKVTGQDASDAALQLEDTMSAFGLSADDAAGFMDTLVASSQKFGTDAGPATLGVLQGMAPALTAMGMGIDDGVALLNAFEVAGVDAAGAQRGLNSAITNLPPGTTMEEFLQHLQDLRNQGIDPTSEAIDVFGNKAGAALALTIKPGGHALDDFRVSAEEAAGAVDQAADDMLTTADKIKMFTEKAGGFLRGLGQDFGPVVTGLASITTLAAPFAKLGLNMASKLKDMFVGLLRNVGILGAAAAVGEATGAAEATAHETAATGPGVVKSLFAKIAAMAIPLAPAGTTVGTAVGGAMAIGIVAGLAGLAAVAPMLFDTLTGNDPATKLRQAGQIGADHYAAGFSDEAKATWAVKFQEGMNAALDQRSLWDKLWNNGLPAAADAGVAHANEYLTGLGTGIEIGAPLVVGPAIIGAIDHSASQWVPVATETGTGIAETIGEGVKSGAAAYQDSLNVTLLNGLRATHMAAAAEARALGAGIPGEIGQGIYDASGAGTFQDALSALRSLMENGLSPKAEGLIAIGKQVLKDFRAGLRSDIPGVKEDAQQVGLHAIDAIEDAGLTGGKGRKGIKDMGLYYDDLLGSGLTKGQVATALKAAGVADAVIAGLEASHEAGLKGEDAVAAYNASIAGGAGTYRKNSNYSGSFFGVKLGTAAGAAGSVRGAVVTALSDTTGFAGYGSSTTGEYASGIDSPAAKKKATDAAHRVLDAVRAVFYTNSPPRDPILHDIGKWGTATIAEYAKGLLGGLGMVQGASSTVAASLTSLNGLSAAAGGLSVGAGSAAGRSMSVDTVNVYVTGVDGDPAEIGKGAADAFIWNLEHAMSAVTSG